MKTTSLGFIGGGRITRILLQGFKNADISFEKISVFETNETVLNALKSLYPQIETSISDPSNAASSDLVFIALHPPVLMNSLQTFKNSIKKDALVLSLAPKVTLEKLQAALPQTPNIARMNPNAGTYVNKGYNPVCFSDTIDQTVLNEFILMFEKLGKVPVVSENQIEAYAVISAMGHTYFWFQLQQLKELALTFGLSEKEAQQTISAMLWGTTETLFSSGLPYEEVTNLVPVKPLAEHEDTIKEFYKTSLNGIFQKIKPQI
jgi:pyrroline-5-carboxylate reductase